MPQTKFENLKPHYWDTALAIIMCVSAVNLNILYICAMLRGCLSCVRCVWCGQICVYGATSVSRVCDHVTMCADLGTGPLHHHIYHVSYIGQPPGKTKPYLWTYSVMHFNAFSTNISILTITSKNTALCWCDKSWSDMVMTMLVPLQYHSNVDVWPQ